MLGHGLLQTWTNDELDYVCKFFQGQEVVPTLALAKNPELVEEDNPEFYDKLTKNLARLMKGLEPLLATYPPGSTIFKEPDACFGPWQPYVVPH